MVNHRGRVPDRCTRSLPHREEVEQRVVRKDGCCCRMAWHAHPVCHSPYPQQEMKIVENSILPLGGYKAFVFLKWIFVHHGVQMSDVDVNHEAIHWEQQKELLVVFFYLLYGVMYLYEWVRCLFDGERGKTEHSWKNGAGRRAYRSVSFEREAYQHEEDTLYIYQRKHYAWINS